MKLKDAMADALVGRDGKLVGHMRVDGQGHLGLTLLDGTRANPVIDKAEKTDNGHLRIFFGGGLVSTSKAAIWRGKS